MSEHPARADAVANRRKLLETARAVFAEHGLDADLREICARSGVGMGTVYRNFATKEDLVEAVALQVLEDMESVCRAAEETSDPVQSLEILLNGAFDVIDDHGWLIQALRQRGDEPPPEALRLMDRVAGVLQRVHDAGRMQRGITPAFASDYLKGFFPMYLDLREVWGAAEARRQCSALFLRGVLSPE